MDADKSRKAADPVVVRIKLREMMGDRLIIRPFMSFALSPLDDPAVPRSHLP